MPVVTHDFLDGLLVQYRAMFHREFEAANAIQGWRPLTIEQSSDGETNTYTWFSTVPTMQDVTDAVVDLQGLEEYDFSISNREWQNAIEVHRTAIERDRLGLITPRVRQLGMEAARHPGELIFELVPNNPTTFTGLSFFNAAHVIGESGTINNIVAGTSAGPYTLAQFQADLGTAVSQMRTFKDDKGRPLNRRGNIIMIPSHMEGVVWQALNRTAGDGVVSPTPPVNESNTWSASGYMVIINPYLDTSDDWYLFHSSGAIFRPFVYQVEKAPVLEADTDPNTRDNIIKRTYLYSVYARYNAGVTDPRLGVQINN